MPRRPTFHLIAAVLALRCAGDAAPVAAPEPAPQAQQHTSPSGQVSATPATTSPPTVSPTLQRHTVTVDDGHAVAVHSKRPARASAAILLVHGRTWSGLPDFDLQVPGERVSLMDALAAAGVATYAIDLRGYGATPRDATGFGTPRRAAADVAAALRFVAEDAAKLGATGKPFLLGWSMGALVSALAVHTDPSQVGGVVLYGYPCRAGAPTPASPDPTTPKRAVNTRAAAASDFITPGSVSQAVIDGFVAAALRADPVRADWRGGAEYDVIRFAELRAPVLVIHGERDPVTDHACMARRFTELTGVDRRWEIVAGSDHAAHLERSSGRFAAAVLAFVGAPR